MGIGGMDIAFNHIVMHQAVDHIGAFTVGGADHQGMPEEITFIYEGIGTDALSLAEVFKWAAGVQAVAAHFKFLTVAGGMEPILCLTVKVRQFHCIHGFDHSVIGRANVF